VRTDWKKTVAMSQKVSDKVTDQPAQLESDAWLDETTRGIPSGAVIFDREIGLLGWKPADGSMPLPVLTMNLGAYIRNAASFFEFAATEGVFLAPHSKTPMIPELATSLLKRGAWGITVANLQQLNVMLRAGIKHVILGSPPGGVIGCSHLVKTIALNPDANVYVFLDSVDGVKALYQALLAAPDVVFHGLIEVGFGRTGARTFEEATAIRDAILETNGTIKLSGIGCYEAAAVTTAEDAQANLSRLFSLVADAYGAVTEKMKADDPVILTAGGSLYFSEVVGAFKPLIADRCGSKLILRSGTLFFSDDGPYHQAFASMAERGIEIGDAIKPVLSIWAEILSRPENSLAIAGFGHRDAPSDMGLPVVKAVFRDGKRIDLGHALLPVVEKLNDHHAFIGGRSVNEVKVGDVIELGISHPCTTLQRWRVIFGLGADGTIECALRTRFG
jgi:D-serine dehydratase